MNHLKACAQGLRESTLISAEFFPLPEKDPASNISVLVVKGSTSLVDEVGVPVSEALSSQEAWRDFGTRVYIMPQETILDLNTRAEIRCVSYQSDDVRTSQDGCNSSSSNYRFSVDINEQIWWVGSLTSPPRICLSDLALYVVARGFIRGRLARQCLV